MFVTNPYYVFINSRDRISGTDENFTFNIQFPTGFDFDSVVVLNAIIPKSYYLIQNGPLENIFQLKENSSDCYCSSWLISTISIQNYDRNFINKCITKPFNIHCYISSRVQIQENGHLHKQTGPLLRH